MKVARSHIVVFLSLIVVLGAVSGCAAQGQAATPPATADAAPAEATAPQHATGSNDGSPQTEEKPAGEEIQLGMYKGRVSYEAEEGRYFIEAKGAKFPFRTDPREAQNVVLDAPGDDVLAKNSALLLGMLGEDVLHVTILISPDEEDLVMPAVADLAMYLQVANRSKFAGVAYTAPGGKMESSVAKGAQVQSLEGATRETPIIRIKGPDSGASSSGVRVLGGGRFIVQGKTYDEVCLAADFVSLSLLKMLCGSTDCPDAAACASGGDCGC
ncbi:MAG: hypothetical protein ACOC6A_04730 [Chloroflexota bacterium]